MKKIKSLQHAAQNHSPYLKFKQKRSDKSLGEHVMNLLIVVLVIGAYLNLAMQAGF
jgi:hypothetical protein